MTLYLSSLSPSPFYNETNTCHVYSDSKLTTYSGMLHRAFISSEVFLQFGPVLSVLCLLCNSVFSVLKADNNAFREYSYMHLNLSEDCCNGAATVNLNPELCSLSRPRNWRTFHVIGRRIMEVGTVRPSVGIPQKMGKCKCGIAILRRVQENSRPSFRGIRAAEKIASTIIWRVLYEKPLRPYHLQGVQVPMPLDFQPR
jgi:hypothetical protein